MMASLGSYEVHRGGNVVVIKVNVFQKTRVLTYCPAGFMGLAELIPPLSLAEKYFPEGNRLKT